MIISNEDCGQQIILSVSELTERINNLLEEKFPFIWISGEISNFTKAASGHFYFSMKDESAQISAVMFKGQNKALRFLPQDGMAITALGRITVYKPRGAYQIIIELMEPKGVGALQIAFEQMKRKLESEGLFDPAHKKPLPFLPQRLTLITSVKGAVVHDIIRVAQRRFENLIIQILSVRVQGEGAETEIKQAIETANRVESDVIILARGGGSMEDLQAFNSEVVARAIFNSDVPVVSAIGHETDYTISDFVSDLRAPTPSAAAELVVPQKANLIQQIDHLEGNLERNLSRSIEHYREKLLFYKTRLVHPEKKIQDLKEKADQLINRVKRLIIRNYNDNRKQLDWTAAKLKLLSPKQTIIRNKTNLVTQTNRLISTCMNRLKEDTYRYANLETSLHALSPLAILERGYSVTRTLPQKKIVKDSRQVHIDQQLEIMLHSGRITVRVNEDKA